MNAVHPSMPDTMTAPRSPTVAGDGRRYHPALVVLHWLLAVLLAFMLSMGGMVLPYIPHDSPDKIGALQGHMIVGAAILVLTLLRMIVRWRTHRPSASPTGRERADRIAVWMHRALYVAVMAMVASGFALSISSGLGQIVFGGVGSLPVTFDAFPARAVHGAVSKIFLALVVAHVGAVLYHHWVRKDGLLRRMGLGRR